MASRRPGEENLIATDLRIMTAHCQLIYVSPPSSSTPRVVDITWWSVWPPMYREKWTFSFILFHNTTTPVPTHYHCHPVAVCIHFLSVIGFATHGLVSMSICHCYLNVSNPLLIRFIFRASILLRLNQWAAPRLRRKREPPFLFRERTWVSVSS